jgi:predicted outer membrane protein
MKLTTLTLTLFALCAVHVPACFAQGNTPDDAAQLKQKLAEQQKQIDALKQAIKSNRRCSMLWPPSLRRSKQRRNRPLSRPRSR